jgi:hypothetical protein
MHCRASLLACVLACSAVSLPGVAQVRSVDEVPLRTELRLQLLDSTIVRGRFAGLEEARIRLNTIAGGAPRPGLTPGSLARDSIAGLWEGSGTRWKLGAAVGAACGILAVFLVARGVGDGEGEGSCDPQCWAAIGGTVLLGGVLGFLVGHQFVVWRPLTF